MSGHRRFQIIRQTVDCPRMRFWLICGHGCQGNSKSPRLSANGFGWTFHPPTSPVWPVCFGLWASTGISGAVSGSIRAALLTRSASIPPTRAQSIALISPPTIHRLNNGHQNGHQKSKKGYGSVKPNMLESLIKSAIFAMQRGNNRPNPTTGSTSKWRILNGLPARANHGSASPPPNRGSPRDPTRKRTSQRSRPPNSALNYCSL
jgi:hypothetical protein